MMPLPTSSMAFTRNSGFMAVAASPAVTLLGCPTFLARNRNWRLRLDT